MELVDDGEAMLHRALTMSTPGRCPRIHAFMIHEVVKMLCAGLVHGDLSEFNVLLDPGGPVIIDLLAVDAAGNNHAFKMLERDVGNMSAYGGQFAQN